MVYNLMKRLIAAGRYDAEDMKTKLDVYLLFGRITQAQYEELMEMIVTDQGATA